MSPEPRNRVITRITEYAQHRKDVVRLTLRPIIRDDAVAFVRQVHRHNKRSLPGWKFGSGLFHDGQLVGVGIAGRCSSRVLDKRGEGHFIEVTRVATNGARNGCSQLYGALLRAARALGYCRAYTYTLDEEGGASLRASGWTIDEVLKPRKGWNCQSRPRDEEDWPEGAKVRWIRWLAPCDYPHELADELRRTWAADTSATPDEWTKELASAGHCAVTALIVQDVLGGDLLRCVNLGESHYYNRLPNGTVIDLTRDQFPRWEPSDEGVRGREYVLSFPETVRRYELLKERLDA